MLRPRRVAVNASWLLGERIVRMGLSLVVGVLIARHLGTAAFGLLNYASALVGLLSPLATLGLEAILVRELVRRPGEHAELLGTALALRVTGGMLCAASAVVLVSILRPGDATGLVVVLLVASATIFQAADVVDVWFQARAHTRPAALARTAAVVLSNGLRIGLLLAGGQVRAFAALVLVEAALVALALLTTHARATGGTARWRARGAEAARLLRESWPLLLSSMAIMVYMRIDVLMLEVGAGLDAVGIYGAATRLSEAWYFVPTAVAAAMAPGINAAHQQNSPEYLARVRWLMGILSAMALSVALVLTVASTPLVRALFGEQYLGAAPVLAVHAWAGLFVALGVGQGVWNVCEGLTRLALARTLAGALLNVVLNLLLIPRFGALGAAVGTVISYALSAYVLNAFDRRTRVIFRIQTEALLLRALLSASPTSASR